MVQLIIIEPFHIKSQKLRTHQRQFFLDPTSFFAHRKIFDPYFVFGPGASILGPGIGRTVENFGTFARRSHRHQKSKIDFENGIR